jgi:methylglutaconyl-CoA hydratase
VSAAEPVLLRSAADGVTRLVLNRPERRNALDASLVEALKDALHREDADRATRVVAIAGAGRDFCSGADLSALRAIAEASVLENLADADALAELFLLLRRLTKPVVALVRGRALAGGAGLATACDLVLASADATIGYPEVGIGFVPAMVMAILRRSVPEKRAFELIATGEPLGAEDAARVGLVNRVYAEAVFEAEAGEFLRRLASRSPSALRLSKRLLYHQDGMTYEAAIRAGADLNVLARMTEDTRDGVRRFLERGARRSP